MDQPGLEVAPQHRHDPDGAASQLPEVRLLEQAKFLVDSPHHKADFDDPEVQDLSSKPAPQSGRRKWFIVGGIAIAILVIVGAVLGGVLGSRAATSTQPEESSANAKNGLDAGTGTGSTTETGTSTTSPSSSPTVESIVRQGSSLTVTSWRGPRGPELFLYFQDRNGKLRQSRYGGSGSSPEWSEPTEMNSSADNTTRLAGTVLLYREAMQPQVELFYTSANRVLGLSINKKFAPEVQPDSVNEERLRPAVNSSIAAYWPWMIYQDTEGDLIQVRNLLAGGSYSPQSSWDVDKLGVFPLLGSSLAVVPLFTNITKSSWKGGYAIFYQGSDNHIHVHIPEINAEDIRQPYYHSLPSSTPTVQIPPRAPIAAFAVARPGDSQTR